MATVRADFLSDHITDDITPVYDPTASPAWVSQSEHRLHRKTEGDGYLVEWKSHDALLLSRTASSPISAAALAYFPDISQKRRVRTGSLCTASGTTVTICTSTLYKIDCLSANRFSDAKITALFPVDEGLIIEVSTSTAFSYHYMSHPLHEITPIDLPLYHRIIYVSTNLPLVASICAGTVYMWATEVKTEAALQINIPVAADGMDETPPSDLEACEEIRPRSATITLTKAHEMDVSPDFPPSVFNAHDLRGLPVVCLVASGSLTGLSMVMNESRLNQLTPSFKIRDVITAVPILSIRKNQSCLDILVQSAMGALSLYAGRNRLCSVNIDHPPTSPFSLVNAVGCNFGIRPTSGASGTRYSLSRCAFVCPLVNQCLAAVSFVLETSGSSRRLAYLYQELIKARSALFDTPSAQSEWELFEAAVLTMGSGAHLREKENEGDARHSSMDSWSFLLSDKHHSFRENTRRLRSTRSPLISDRHPCKDPDATQTTTVLEQVFQALHLLYEDFKLDSHKQAMLRRFVTLPARIAAQLRAVEFLNHYRRDFPQFLSTLQIEPVSSSTSTRTVASIVESITDRIQGVSPRRPYPIVFRGSELKDEVGGNVSASWRTLNPFELSKRVLSYYDTLYDPAIRTKLPERRSEILLFQMTKDGFTREDLDCLPLGVCLPLRDTLFVGRALPRLKVTTQSLALLSREDMLEVDSASDSMQENNERFITETTAMLRLNSFAGPAYSSISPREPPEDVGTEKMHGLVDDEDDVDDSPHLHRFCEDRRIQEVKRILRSTDETVISSTVPKPSEASAEFDLAGELRQKLEVLVKKRLAAPVGRGAFTLRTFTPSDPTKPLFIPKLCTSGKLLGQKGARVTLASTEPEHLQWGEFHNGVAAGLRIVASSSTGDQEVGHILSRTWIVNHRPEDMSGCAGHAGMLLACGLGGYLPALRKTDYYQYLLSRHELTSIGLMLGLSVCNIGSMDEKITKMLCLHIRSFNAAGFAVPDFLVTVNTQAAAVLGLGLLHKASPELGVVEGLMQELAYKPKPGDAIDNREGLALAAGLSLGLVCLGNGSAIDAAESGLSERLLTLANGGVSRSRARQSGNSVFGRDREDESAAQGAAPLAESETSRIAETGKINTDVASPGALLALAMIYMKTNDALFTERIQLPNTLYSLDRLKPLHVYLVVLVRALVMWDSISATAEWVAESIPTLLHGVSAEGELDALNLHGKVNVPIGLRDDNIDVDGVLQARAFAIAGAWTAIGIRHAGTCDEAAMSMIKAGCESFEGAMRKCGNEDVHMQWVYMTCMCSAAVSLSIVMAGSGDLGTLRLFRRLRKVSVGCLAKRRYGFHLAVHQAIGFLFLGGGCLTFGSSAEAIFGLVCAGYPHLPRDVNDNRYHLQALRHLYVLSVEPRCIETRDVDTGRACSVEVVVRLRGGASSRAARAPCIVPDARSVREVVVASERYMPRAVRLHAAGGGRGWFSRTSSQVVYVKRRVGHLPHEADPRGSRSMLARTLRRGAGGAGDGDLATAYGADPDVLAFDARFCRGDGARRATEALHECLGGDRTAALYAYVELWRLAAALRRGASVGPQAEASLTVLGAYVEADAAVGGSLVRPSLVAAALRLARARDCKNS